MRLKKYNVELNEVQIGLLRSMSDLVLENARSPTKTNVTIYRLDKLMECDRKTIRTNLNKLKDLNVAC